MDWSYFVRLADRYRPGECRIFASTYVPGGDTGPDMLTHEGEEAGVIISGTIELTVGSQSENSGRVMVTTFQVGTRTSSGISSEGLRNCQLLHPSDFLEH